MAGKRYKTCGDLVRAVGACAEDSRYFDRFPNNAAGRDAAFDYLVRYRPFLVWWLAEASGVSLPALPYSPCSGPPYCPVCAERELGLAAERRAFRKGLRQKALRRAVYAGLRARLAGA